MSTIYFRTPGSIDPRAFTTMGVNAKPATHNPIGYFGTGLKYAVAVLCRLGARFEVLTGGDRLVFETRPLKFRGEEFQQVVMRRDRWTGGQGWRLGRAKKLPFTTQYGRNWEAWMAFRELYANTLDENGETRDYPDGVVGLGPEGDETVIIVGDCEEFHQAYLDRDNIFLDKSKMEVIGGVAGQLEVMKGKSDHLYYQGLRAKDLAKPTLHTYNFQSAQALTEDRQLAHEWQVKSLLANAVAKSDDEALIESIVTVGDDHWEHNMEPDSWVTPSRAFHNVMLRVGPGRAGLGFSGYYRRHDIRPEASRDYWRDAPRPWKVDGGDILAADGSALFSKPYNMNDASWNQLALHVTAIGNGGMAEEHRQMLDSELVLTEEAETRDEGDLLGVDIAEVAARDGAMAGDQFLTPGAAAGDEPPAAAAQDSMESLAETIEVGPEHNHSTSCPACNWKPCEEIPF